MNLRRRLVALHQRGGAVASGCMMCADGEEFCRDERYASGGLEAELLEQYGGFTGALFANVFGYSFPWTLGVALWGYAIGYPLLWSALIGFAIAVAGSVWVVLTAPSRLERAMRTLAAKTSFGQIGTVVLFTGAPAAIISWLVS